MRQLLMEPMTVRPAMEEDQVIWQKLTQKQIDKKFILVATKTLADSVLLEVYFEDGKPEKKQKVVKLLPKNTETKATESSFGEKIDLSTKDKPDNIVKIEDLDTKTNDENENG